MGHGAGPGRQRFQRSGAAPHAPGSMLYPLSSPLKNHSETHRVQLWPFAGSEKLVQVVVGKQIDAVHAHLRAKAVPEIVEIITRMFPVLLAVVAGLLIHDFGITVDFITRIRSKSDPEAGRFVEFEEIRFRWIFIAKIEYGNQEDVEIRGRELAFYVEHVRRIID